MSMIPPRQHRVLRALALGAVAAAGPGLGGCKTESMDPYVYADGHPKQKYEFKEVKRRTRSLRPGMPRSEVLITLGSPAEVRGDTWVYLPEQAGYILPTELLEVRFQGGRYVTHEFKAIVFGQRPVSK
jgi:outer membrane protein assembly factor BamE (lipoprotein component of BamABCDE complex)